MVLEMPVITVDFTQTQTRGMMMVIQLGMNAMRMMIMMEDVSTHYLNYPAQVLFLSHLATACTHVGSRGKGALMHDHIYDDIHVPMFQWLIVRDSDSAHYLSLCVDYKKSTYVFVLLVMSNSYHSSGCIRQLWHNL